MKATLFVIASVGALLLGACTVADLDGSPTAGSSKGTGAPGSSGTAAPAGQCTDTPAPKLEPTDPNTLPKCACGTGGAARCVPKEKIPSNVQSNFDACTAGGAGLCVPDKLVASGGAAPLTCKSAFGEGRCMNLCIPEVAKNSAALNRGEGDICGTDEKCVPCLNPLKNNEPTGACEIGKEAPPIQCDPPAGSSSGGTASGSSGSPAPALACPYTGAPIVDVTTFPSCGDGARCVPTTIVPASAAALLKACPTGLCAPEKTIAAGGQYLPKTCASVGGAEGRCTNVNIPAIEAQKAMLTKDTCDANELCAPCFSPLDGKDTGACKTVTCDAPKQAAKVFSACCSKHGTSRAKCVPKSVVPAAEQANLDDDDGTCTKDVDLCVPNEMLQPNFKGPACTGSTLLTGGYTGVCLSDCLHFDFISSLGISKGSCQDDFKCAPCVNPLNGKPTGAPGCPGT